MASTTRDDYTQISLFVIEAKTIMHRLHPLPMYSMTISVITTLSTLLNLLGHSKSILISHPHSALKLMRAGGILASSGRPNHKSL